jgi:triacylglycerol lipase
MNYLQRIWPSLLVTAFFSLLFFSLYEVSSGFFSIVAASLLSITLWLGFIYVVNEARFSFPKPIRTTIRWLHAMSFELIITFLAHFLFRPLMRFFGNPWKKGVQNGTPILLVHGYLWDWTGWLYIRWKLARAGLGPIYAMDLHHVFDSISEYAKEVSEVANRIEKETQKKELILIGHSMGGLVICTYATELAPAGKVKAVIAIGSPFNGTHAAHVGIGQNVKEMLPDSSFVQKVQESMEKHPEIQFYQVMSQADELIIPQLSAFANERFDHHYIVDDIGHMTLLFSSRVANRVCLWVKYTESGQQELNSSKSLKSG